MEIVLKHIDVKINTEYIFNKERNGKIVVTKRLDGLYEGYFYYKNKHGSNFEIYLTDVSKEVLIRDIREKIKLNISEVNKDLLLNYGYKNYKIDIASYYDRLDKLSVMHSLLGTIDKRGVKECECILKGAYKTYCKFVKLKQYTHIERVKAYLRYFLLRVLINNELSKV
jgi:hypothetical protein